MSTYQTAPFIVLTENNYRIGGAMQRYLPIQYIDMEATSDQNLGGFMSWMVSTYAQQFNVTGNGAGTLRMDGSLSQNLKDIDFDLRTAGNFVLDHAQDALSHIFVLDSHTGLTINADPRSGVAREITINCAASHLTSLVTTGYDVVNLQSSGINQGNTIDRLSLGASSVLHISDQSSLTLGEIQAGTIDGSAMYGSLVMKIKPSAAGTAGVEIRGGKANDILRGSSGVDHIDGKNGNDMLIVAGAAQADVLTGGNGADKFRFEATTWANLMKVSGGTGAVVSITDFHAGEDKIVLAGNTGLGQARLVTLDIASAQDRAGVYDAITASHKVGTSGFISWTAAWIASTALVKVGAGGAAGTYLFVNDTANDASGLLSSGKDMLIELTGLTGTFSAGDIVVGV